jgi:hypothetical protein
VGVTERVRGPEIDDDEGQRLLRSIRRGTGSLVTWPGAQMVLAAPCRTLGDPAGRLGQDDWRGRLKRATGRRPAPGLGRPIRSRS